MTKKLAVCKDMSILFHKSYPFAKVKALFFTIYQLNVFYTVLFILKYPGLIKHPRQAQLAVLIKKSYAEIRA